MGEKRTKVRVLYEAEEQEVLFNTQKGFGVKLYGVLRQYMDGETKEVGNLPSNRITWEVLAQEMYLEEVAGSHEGYGKPTKNKLRKRMGLLIKAGLVVSKSEERRVILYLPLAPEKLKKQPKKQGVIGSPGGGTYEEHIRWNTPDLDENINSINCLPEDEFNDGTQEEHIRWNSYSIYSKHAQPVTDNFSIHISSLPLDTFARNDSSMCFDEFWKFYPKKTTKKEARAYWIAKKLDECLPAILADIEQRKGSDEWIKGFILDPIRYLKRERWEDEYKGKPSAESVEAEAKALHDLEVEKAIREFEERQARENGK